MGKQRGRRQSPASEESSVAVAEKCDDPIHELTEQVVPKPEGHGMTVHIARIVETANYRRKRDETADAELEESIRTVNIVQPLVVREISSGEFELVCGKRRLDAARAVGLQLVPVFVRELTDEQVLEVRLVENVQRKDVDPLEEADGFFELVSRFSYTLERLRQRTGRSIRWVGERLALAKLCPAARELYAQGKISASHALEIARLGSIEDQDAAVEWINKEHPDGLVESDDNFFGLSVADLRDELHERFTLDMKSAPWKLDEELLVSIDGGEQLAPVCSTCTKRTKNSPQLFPDDVAAGDRCTDSVCWALKLGAHRATRAAELAAKGVKVLERKDAKQAIDRWGNAKGDWVRLDQAHVGDKPVGKALGKSLAPEQRAIAFVDGKEVELARRDDVAAAAKDAKVKVNLPRKAGDTGRVSSSKSSVDSYQKRQERAQLQRPFAKRIADDLVKSIVEKIGEPKVAAKLEAYRLDSNHDSFFIDGKVLSDALGLKLKPKASFERALLDWAGLDQAAARSLLALSGLDNALVDLRIAADNTWDEPLAAIGGKEFSELAAAVGFDLKAAIAAARAEIKAGDKPASSKADAQPAKKKRSAKK